MRIALVYEHPHWSLDLVDRMNDRGIDVTPIDIGSATPRFPDPTLDRFDLWVNRVNAMPSNGRSPSVVAATGHLLLSLEATGQRMFNGHRCFVYGGSKAAQAALFTQSGALAPPAIGILAPTDALAAADQIGYPILTKPNCGGSGHGIAVYHSPAELATAIETGNVDLGVDGTGLVQKAITSADGLVHRIEILGDELFYATDQPIADGAFNYCAIDGCPAGDTSARSISVVDPGHTMTAVAVAIVRRAEADIAGIEYLINADDGLPYVYDFNPYSNFVVGFEREIGFDPMDRYIDAVVAKAQV
jgi:hypothetical protein